MSAFQFRLGSISHPLHAIYTEQVQQSLQAEYPDLTLSIRSFTPVTSTETDNSALLAALLADEIDAVILPYAEMPAELSGKLNLSAVPERTQPSHLFCTNRQHKFASLPAESVVATYGLGRIAQLRRHRSDITFLAVETPASLLEGLNEGWDGIVIDAALRPAMQRLFTVIEELSPVMLLPLPTQGACAILTHTRPAHDLITALHDQATHWQVSAEDAFLQAFGSTQPMPLAAHAQLEGGQLSLTARALSAEGDGSIEVHGEAHFRPDTLLEYAEVLGLQVAKLAVERGADDLMRDSS
jgi:hydroxymethylbilane synthase